MGKAKYSPEAVAWLEEQCENDEHSWKELSNMFSKLFFPTSAKTLSNYATQRGINKHNVFYSDIEKQWLWENKDNYTFAKLADLFSVKFRHTSADSIKNVLKRMGYSKSIESFPYTEEERDWLVENIPKHRRSEIPKLFAERFPDSKKHLNIKRVQSFANSHHLQYSDELRKELVKESSHNANSYPVGSEYYNRRRNQVWVKVTDNNIGKSWRSNWELKKLVVWKQNYGEIPDDQRVLCSDGDELNTDIGNLMLVPVEVSNSWNAFRRHYKNLTGDMLKALLLAIYSNWLANKKLALVKEGNADD